MYILYCILRCNIPLSEVLNVHQEERCRLRASDAEVTSIPHVSLLRRNLSEFTGFSGLAVCLFGSTPTPGLSQIHPDPQTQRFRSLWIEKVFQFTLT